MSNHSATDVDVVVVGAGFAGMYMLHRLRKLNFSSRVFEAGSGVGGTWYWNRYPGARCDVESVEYSYSFDEDLQQEWEWVERYTGQPELLRYANHVADRFDLRSGITFDTRVETATYDEAANRWLVTTDTGEEVTATFVVMATGCLSSANTPDIEGRDSFAGETYHTGQWPHEGVDFVGKRVGVIGTGSSAVQSIPVIAETAGELTVFQRTAQYAVPARNRAPDEDYVAWVKADYANFRKRNASMPGGFGSNFRGSAGSAVDATPDELRAELDRRWERGGFEFLGAFTDARTDEQANERIAAYVRERIAEIVEDPETAAKLMPTTLIGCKRLCLDSGYFETYNRPNVHLVDLSSAPIDRITEQGIMVDGEVHELDCLIFATGFDAMTGTLLKIQITGRDGVTLAEQWHAGPRTYLGLGVPKLPNLFMVSGPGSPSVLTNMIVSIEQHVDWITDCIDSLRANGQAVIEATDQAADDWVLHVNEVADTTLFPTCNSWYLGANIPGKTRVFMPLYGFPPYVEKCNEVKANGYEGFVLS